MRGQAEKQGLSEPDASYTSARVLRNIAKGAAIGGIVLGVSVLCGWWWNIRFLVRVGSDWPPMSPVCALEMVLFGAGLWLALAEGEARSGKARIRGGQALGFVVAIFGVLLLSEHLFGWDSGFQAFVKRCFLPLGVSGIPSIAFPSALSAMGLGSGLVLMDLAVGGVWLAEVCAVITMQVTLLAVVGHTFGVAELYGGFEKGSGMAMHAGVGFLALATGLLFVRPNRGIMAIVRSQTPGGTMARRWMFMPGLLLLAMGVVYLVLERGGPVPHVVSSWSLFMTSMVVLTIAVWATAGVLYRAGLERDRAQRTLEERVRERTADLDRANKALSATKEELARAISDLERTVEERTLHLKETIRSLETVCYNIAHDLRAPNRAIAGFAEVLVAEHASRLDSTALDCLSRIGAAARHSDALTLDLLEYGRLGHADLPCGRESLGTHLRQVIARLESDITATGAIIEVSEPLPWLWANPTALEQVLTNVLTNAMKFIADGVKPRVRIRAVPAGNCTRVIVEDNGIGVPAEHQQEIFGVFQRLDISDKYPGSGIGLAIVHKCVERMGGKVGVYSAPGHGSCFWFELRTA